MGTCKPTIKRDFQVKGAGVQSYSLTLSEFSIQEACGLANVAAILATGVTQVNVQVLGSNVQYSKVSGEIGWYANGLNFGPISFD